MDTVILVLSAAVVFTIGYGVFWTVRRVRRVGMRRFGRAVGQLGRAVLVAVAKLFTPVYREIEQNSGKKDNYGWGDAWDDLRIARKWQRISEENSKLGHTREL